MSADVLDEAVRAKRQTLERLFAKTCGLKEDPDWLLVAMNFNGTLKALEVHAEMHAEEDRKLGVAFDAWLENTGPEATARLFEAIGDWRFAGRGGPLPKEGA